MQVKWRFVSDYIQLNKVFIAAILGGDIPIVERNANSYEAYQSLNGSNKN